MAALLSHRFRFVTLEGEVVNLVSMTGGSMKKKQTTLLGRKREIEELTAKLTSLKKVVEQLELQVKELKEQQTAAEEELESLRVVGEQARNSVQEAKAAVRELELETSSMKEQFQRFEREQSNFLLRANDWASG